MNNKSDKSILLLAVGLQKPGLKSKAEDHKECFKSRLLLWKNGEINTLMNEGWIIQSRIGKGKKSSQPNRAKIFAKLVMEGQINLAMRFLNDDTYGGRWCYVTATRETPRTTTNKIESSTSWASSRYPRQFISGNKWRDGA